VPIPMFVGIEIASASLCWGHLNVPKNCLRPGTRHMGYKHCSETA
jgi:hypothetical protein